MTHFSPDLRKQGLSDQQWRVLRVLGEHAVEGGVDTGTIANKAYLLGPSLTGVLTRMERDGLIKRQRDTLDARRTLVAATAKGKRLVLRLSTSIEAHYAVMERALGKAQLATMYQLLDAVIAMNSEAAQ